MSNAQITVPNFSSDCQTALPGPSAIIGWEPHDEDNGVTQDMQSECGRFEAIQDATYGYYTVRRTDHCIPFTPEEAEIDPDICIVGRLSEAQEPIEAYLRATAG